MPAPAGGSADPNQLGIAFGRISATARKQARVAVAVAGALLESGELVEAVVAGTFEGHPAVLVLTDRGLVLADEREWQPFTRRLPVDGGLTVQGWQDDRAATLTLSSAHGELIVDQIADRPLAVEMAQRIRYRTGATA